jgi:hypothetical protein
MSMRNEGPDPVDALIDAAARQLVAGEPSAALRSSVRDRIGARRPVWSFVPALAGAAAFLVVAVIVGRGPVGRIVSGPAGPPGEPDRVRTAEASPAIERASNDAPSQLAIEPPRTRSVRLQADPVPQEEESPIPPIAIEPLVTVQIAGDVSSGVMPIDIAPLQIEPLLGQ